MKTYKLVCFLIIIISSIHAQSLHAQQRQLYYVGGYPLNPCFNVHQSNNYIFLSGFSGIQLIDYSNMSNPVSAGSLGLPQYSTALLIEGNYLYASGGFNGGFNVINISVLPGMTLAGSNNNNYGTSYQMAKKQDFVYFTTNADTLYIMDVSVSSNPVVSFRMGLNEFTSGIAIYNNTLFLGGSSGIHIYDISNLTLPVYSGSYPGTFGALAIDTSLQKLYAYTGFGITSLDISNNTTPVLIEQFNSSFSGAVINPLAFNGNDLFRVSGGTLEVFESGISNPNVIDSWNFGVQVNAVAVVDSFVLVSSINGLSIMKYGYIDPLGTSNLLSNLPGVSVYPNPFSECIDLSTSWKGSNPGELYYKIYDSKGVVVHENNSGMAAATGRIWLRQLNPGVYYIEVQTQQNRLLKSIIKVVKIQ